MYQSLGNARLKNQEEVEIGRITCPDLEWADRIESLLGHKEPLYLWQNSTVIRNHCGLGAYFYPLHHNGIPLASMMIVEHQHVGFFGHVWTQPEHRRKGAAAILMKAVMQDFKDRHGQALFLSTDYDSAAYHIYQKQGFKNIEEKSGQMAWYAVDARNFYSRYFESRNVEIRDLQWCDWPASGALFLGDFEPVIRSANMKNYGRYTTEESVLKLLHDEKKRADAGHPPQAKVLSLAQTGAVAGLAHWQRHPGLDQTCVLDFFCHPEFDDFSEDLMRALVLPDGMETIAFVDRDDRIKADLLSGFGFKRELNPVRSVREYMDDFAAPKGIDSSLWVKHSAH